MTIKENRLASLFKARQQVLQGGFAELRAASEHSAAKGDGFETAWRKVLTETLPGRYFVEKGFAYDTKGEISDEIDILILDRQYSPLFFNDSGRFVVPAESIYAAIEVKPTINAAHMQYASEKARSIRTLHRTTTPIPHMAGTAGPKDPHHIICGLIGESVDWTPPFGNPFAMSFDAEEPDGQLDFAMGLSAGCFWKRRYLIKSQEEYETNSEQIEFSGDLSLLTFSMILCEQLRLAGTVPALSYEAYLKAAGAI